MNEHQRDPTRRAVRIAVAKALKDGALVRAAACADCGCQPYGQVKLHGHHEDYGRPLDVVWLCPVCHRARHRASPEQIALNGRRRKAREDGRLVTEHNIAYEQFLPNEGSIARRRARIVKALLDAGIDPSTRNWWGNSRTPPKHRRAAQTILGCEPVALVPIVEARRASQR